MLFRALIAASLAALFLLVAWVFGLPPLTPPPLAYHTDGPRLFHCLAGDHDFAVLVTFSNQGRVASVELDGHQARRLNYSGASWFANDAYSDGVATFVFGEEDWRLSGMDHMPAADCHG